MGECEESFSLVLDTITCVPALWISAIGQSYLHVYMLFVLGFYSLLISMIFIWFL